MNVPLNPLAKEEEYAEIYTEVMTVTVRLVNGLTMLVFVKVCSSYTYFNVFEVGLFWIIAYIMGHLYTEFIALKSITQKRGRITKSYS